MDFSPRTDFKYDVFLSFRGEDTRRSFTDHLYAALIQKGFTLFMDHQNLERGKEISSELLKAIEDSKVLIVIFSRNYASSTWCLDELAKIVSCMEKKQVVPIFYNINPSDVRKQTGDFEKAFDKHEEDFRNCKEKVQKWRNALVKVANLSGWDLKDRHESEFIQDIVKEISTKLNCSSLIGVMDLVGIGSRMEKLGKLICVGSNDVRMIGICGMGGIGKTTIARFMYESISGEFEGSSFLSSVREISEKFGFISLQKQLLSEILMGTNCNIYNVSDGISKIRSNLRHKKVLLVIDDVVHVEQLNMLAGKHDWFGLGSRIIITTRDEHLLTTNRVDKVYKVQELNYDEAFELFRLKAFDHKPSKDYLELSKLFVKYAGGLPLALQVLGSFLLGRTIEEWKGALERINKDSERKILDILQVSFDGLEETEKKIFLDVACFFKGENIDYVTKILDGCGFYPSIGISVLIDKSLITILNNNKIWMHDLLQEMGRQIVKRESPNEPGKRSRLWEETNIRHVLTQNTGTRAVEGIIFNFLEEKVHLSAKTFLKMTNLRLLKIVNVQLSEGLEYLSNELRLLKWHGYPLKSLPPNLQLDKLIELKMHSSCIEQLWEGMKPLNQLKSIDLSHSAHLNKTPDFTWAPNLEKLILEGCTKLCEVHPSLVVHRKLILLNLKDCTSLTTLPSRICMESLRKLVLSGCLKLRKFPEIVGSMEYLSELFLDGTAIKELPSSVERLTGLILLNLKDCNKLENLPTNLNGLKILKTLDISGCSKLKNMPGNLGQVESLEELAIGGTAIRRPVSSIFLMKNLKSLSFRGCKGPPSKSWFSSFLSKLLPSSRTNPMALVLPSLSGLCSLKKMDLSDCNLGEGAIPRDFGSLVSLEELNLSKNNFVSLPASINRLYKLQYLNLEGCNMLQSLPELPSNINTVKLDACTSLETLSDAFKFCKSEWSAISCMNCPKLQSCNDIALSMLKRYLKAVSNPRMEFSIVVLGSEIPKWVSYQSEGSSIKIQRPPPMYNGCELVGYVVCSVFVVHKHEAAHSDVFGTHKLFCHLKADQELSSTSHFIHFEVKFGQAMQDHLWLHYLSLQEYFDLEWHNDYNHIEFLFATQWGPGLEVKRCGVQPIYEQAVEQFHQTVNQYSGSTFGNFDKFHEDFIGTMDATTKRSLPDNDRVEPSGSDYYGEEPRTKRIKETR